jgi:FKBP-type peptidyl-prolyl cis-trans isomerase FkpA
MRHRLPSLFGLSVLATSLAVAAEPPPSNPVAAGLAQGRGVSGMVVADGWKVVELERGAGEPTQAGAWVRFNYTGWFHDPKAPEGKGEQFDSSADRGEPFVFQLGKQRVIMGWEAGLLGMRAGGKRRLVVPPQLGFGDKGAGGRNGAKAIPPNSTLVFEVELIDFLAPIPKP